MNDLSERVKSVLEEAVSLSRDEREAFLARVYDSEPGLRALVSELLQYHDEAVAVGFLGSDGLDPPSALGPPASKRVFEEGQVVCSRFLITHFLGRGGYGEVYRAEDSEFPDHPVALKTLRVEVASNEAAVRRFRREIELARAITHPNVCRIFDIHRHVDDARSVTFFTMTLLGGETLSARLARLGRLSEAEALTLLRSVCAGLAAVHEAGVIHRDLKCSNVLLEQKASGLEPIITDFGLALLSPRRNDGSVFSTSGLYLGTPAYMAPEQIEGGDFSEATDIYALGVVCYEMLTGRLPFEADSRREMAMKRLTEPPRPPREVLPNIDPRWESVILKCLERHPDARFSSPLDVVGALSDRSEEHTPERPLPTTVQNALDKGEDEQRRKQAQLATWLIGGVTFATVALTSILVLGLVSDAAFDAALGVPWELRAGSLRGSFRLGLQFLAPVAGAAVYEGILLAGLYLVAKCARYLIGKTRHTTRSPLAWARNLVTSLDPTTLTVGAVACSFGALIVVQALYWNLLRTIIRMTGGEATHNDTGILCDVFETYHVGHTLAFTFLLALLGATLFAFRRIAQRRRYTASLRRLGTLGVTGAILASALLFVVPYRILWQNESEKVTFDQEHAFIVGRGPSRFALFFPAAPERRGLTSHPSDPLLELSGEWGDLFECQSGAQ